MSFESAFAAIRKLPGKVLARRNFMCCGTCAGAALGDACEKSGARGAVYYHRQNGERLTSDGYAYVNYGLKDKNDGDEALFGAEVAAVFRAHGCPVDWSGSVDDALRVWRDEESRRAYAARRLGDAA